jgi:hypothetical protein
MAEKNGRFLRSCSVQSQLPDAIWFIDSDYMIDLEISTMQREETAVLSNWFSRFVKLV